MMEYLRSTEFSNYGTNWFHTDKGGGKTSGATTRWKRFREEVEAPVYPICTPVSSKYPNGVTPSTYWGKRINSLLSGEIKPCCVYLRACCLLTSILLSHP
nr:putative ATPase subunit 8 [Picea sitchensis]